MTLETVPWRDLEHEFLNSWGRPAGRVESEHVAVIGPTRSGKSYFLTYIAKARAALRGTACTVIATKAADKTLRDTGWPVIRDFPPSFDARNNYILWPQASQDENASLLGMHRTIKKALNSYWTPDANRLVIFDEIAFIEQELKLKTLINRYWRESAALGITVAATTQRPRNVSRYMWSEPAWLVSFRPPDEDEARRVAEIIGGKRLMLDSLLSLTRHQFIIINRNEREAFISKLGT